MAIEKRKGRHGTTYRVVIYDKAKKICSASFDTLAIARAYEAETKSQISRGMYVDRRAMAGITLSDALDKYVATISCDKRDGAKRRETSQAKQIKKYPVALLPLSDIRSSDIAAFRDARLSTCTANTTRLALALVSSLFTVARKEWGFEHLINPVQAIRKPSVASSVRDRRLVGDEHDRLMQSAKSYGGMMRLIIPFAIETAMRQSEITGIHPAHVDLNAHTVFLPVTKNGSPRVVPLSRRAYRIICMAMRRSSSGQPIFCMTSDGVRTSWRRIVDRATPPLVDLRFHDLRHEATSRLFEKGLSTEQVKTITGHKTYQMLARYTHLKANDLVSLLG